MNNNLKTVAEIHMETMVKNLMVVMSQYLKVQTMKKTPAQMNTQIVNMGLKVGQATDQTTRIENTLETCLPRNSQSNTSLDQQKRLET